MKASVLGYYEREDEPFNIMDYTEWDREYFDDCADALEFASRLIRDGFVPDYTWSIAGHIEYVLMKPCKSRN